MPTGFLKIIALFLMLMDHITYFIPDMPEYFHWLGRLSAPIFIFCLVIGFTHTRDQKKYLFRLYIFSVCMGIFNLFLNTIYQERYFELTNNFFTPLFLIALIIYLIIENNKKYWLLFLGWQVISFIFIVIMVEFLCIPNLSSLLPTYMFYGTICANIIFIEGGILFVILGVIFYFTRNNKINFSIFYIFFCIVIYFLDRRYGNMREIVGYLIPFGSEQWMMCGAFPFMLFYNGKKGIGLKYLFYIFYPLHIYLLYLIRMNLF